MALAKSAENVQHQSPDDNEEDKDQDCNYPNRGIFRAPEILPRPSILRRKEVVLQNDCDKKPRYEFATNKGLVEAWDLSGALMVVCW